MKNGWPRVGIIGANQFTQMMLAPAAALGIELISFAKSENNPAALFGPHIIGDYTNFEQVQAFAKTCDVVTFENGEIPLSIINGLERDGIVVRPNSSNLKLSKDRSLVKEKLPSINSAITSNRNNFDYEVAVTVARSPHGQASTWVPTEIIKDDGIWIETLTPSPKLSDDLNEEAQKLALEIAEEIKLIGVMTVEIIVVGENLFINDLDLGPSFAGNWTIEGSKTSQFEQHLRAILDLPLGETSMTAKYAVTGKILVGSKTDMYRPYLHLMARTPNLKFHQYRKESSPGEEIGHITLLGSDLEDLQNEVNHALDYLSGEVDE